MYMYQLSTIQLIIFGHHDDTSIIFPSLNHVKIFCSIPDETIWTTSSSTIAQITCAENTQKSVFFSGFMEDDSECETNKFPENRFAWQVVRQLCKLHAQEIYVEWGLIPVSYCGIYSATDLRYTVTITQLTVVTLILETIFLGSIVKFKE